MQVHFRTEFQCNLTVCIVDKSSKCLILAATRNAFVPRVVAQRTANAQVANAPRVRSARLAAHVHPRRNVQQDARSHAAVAHRRGTSALCCMMQATENGGMFFYYSSLSFF
ncbi:uncharacterized protein LOC119592972 [Penaeus monodon]|uniref:uncharacterized protein LOC119592972 n=1 Tax=Penaeus monodon TaxID=6687 RepID=UPI0018A73B06|nr:uncharacterized protein LOC119592972 [Penaeus monodon]